MKIIQGEIRHLFLPSPAKVKRTYRGIDRIGFFILRKCSTRYGSFLEEMKIIQGEILHPFLPHERKAKGHREISIV